MTTSSRVNKLKAAMHGMAGQTESSTAAGMAPPALSTPAVREERTPLAPSRRGKRNVSAYIDATAAKQLRLLAVDRETSTQALVEEALNDLFLKHGRSAIA